MLHLAQEQDGYVTNEAMAHIAELVGVTPAEVYGTATFYEMFKFEPVGKYLINICGTMSCALLGAEELMHHAEERLGIKAGGTPTTACSRCTTPSARRRAPRRPACRSTTATATGSPPSSSTASSTTSPPGASTARSRPHGTVATVRQHIPPDRAVGAVDPDDVRHPPAWFPKPESAGAGAS